MHQIMGPAIAARIFPGCVILAARGGRVLHHAAYGSTLYDDPGTRPVAPDDSFDLAAISSTQSWRSPYGGAPAHPGGDDRCALSHGPA